MNRQKERRDRFAEVLTEAVRDFAEHGYDSKARLDYWLGRLREAAMSDLPPAAVYQRRIDEALSAIYQRIWTKAGVSRSHAGLHHYDISSLADRFRPVLRQRILASADLIKLNREQAVETTLKRFSGWASSVPYGGSRAIEKNEVKAHIAKPLRSQSFEERRVAIDQGHKLISNINRTVAEERGAIAAIWHSHWRQAGYHYREDHKERDGDVYAIRGNWAAEKGLMKAGKAGYLDEITQPAEEPFCRCFAQYLYNLRDLPPEMLTEKGLLALNGRSNAA